MLHTIGINYNAFRCVFSYVNIWQEINQHRVDCPFSQERNIRRKLDCYFWLNSRKKITIRVYSFHTSTSIDITQSGIIYAFRCIEHAVICQFTPKPQRRFQRDLWKRVARMTDHTSSTIAIDSRCKREQISATKN